MNAVELKALFSGKIAYKAILNGMTYIRIYDENSRIIIEIGKDDWHFKKIITHKEIQYLKDIDFMVKHIITDLLSANNYN